MFFIHVWHLAILMSPFNKTIVPTIVLSLWIFTHVWHLANIVDKYIVLPFITVPKASNFNAAIGQSNFFVKDWK